jgi:hypothetical protein
MFLQLMDGGREARPLRQLTDRLLFAVFPDAGSASAGAQRRQELLKASIERKSDCNGPPARHAASRRRFCRLAGGDRIVADERIRPVGWAVHEFALVHSLLGRGRYNVLARFPVRAQA